MKIRETSLPGILLIEPNIFGDARGSFMEIWSAQRYAEAGIDAPFVQDNVSRSKARVLRGLHLQHPHGQGKLVQVLAGAIFDVAVDLRVDSANFGRWYGTTLSAENARQLWVPAGFGHGFCVTGDEATFVYKCTDYYAPEAEFGVVWDDPEIAVDWPVTAPIVSEKDAALPRLSEIRKDRLPHVGTVE